MKSTSGQHFLALDHIRAVAAFMVFSWHFTHSSNGYPVPFEYTPALLLFPFALLDEGHTGVALFMTLSGYLFAKLLEGKKIDFVAFVWNRILRLVPLLLVVVVIVGVRTVADRGDLVAYFRSILLGAMYPSLPNGGWSITVEFHFYLVLPVLLWMGRKSKWLPVSVLIAALLARYAIWVYRGQAQSLAYWTIIGHMDQFVLGMLAYRFAGILPPPANGLYSQLSSVLPRSTGHSTGAAALICTPLIRPRARFGSFFRS